jgi:hypothetical protein
MRTDSRSAFNTRWVMALHCGSKHKRTRKNRHIDLIGGSACPRSVNKPSDRMVGRDGSLNIFPANNRILRIFNCTVCAHD